MAINTFLSCPDDCDDDLLLPGIPQDQDCTNWYPKDSQVGDLFLFPSTAPKPSDWTDPNTWSGTINNVDTSNAAGKWIVGEGGVDAVQITLLSLPKKKERVTGRTFVLSFEIDHLSGSMYAFLRAFQCGWTNFTFFYRTVGGRLFGADGGIIPISVDVDFPLDEDREEFETAVVGITFEADATPDRVDGSGLDDVLATLNPWITPDGDEWVTPDGDAWVWSP
jgi:hypothetical protein